MCHMTNRAQNNVKAKGAEVHHNRLAGKRCKHALGHLAAHVRLKMTPKDLSTLKVYSHAIAAVPVNADVSQLETALQQYWQAENLDGGVLPADTELILGSRIKLWEQQTHEDRGYASGHPNLDGWARCVQPLCAWESQAWLSENSRNQRFSDCEAETPNTCHDSCI